MYFTTLTKITQPNKPLKTPISKKSKCSGPNSSKSKGPAMSQSQVKIDGARRTVTFQRNQQGDISTPGVLGINPTFTPAEARPLGGPFTPILTRYSEDFGRLGNGYINPYCKLDDHPLPHAEESFVRPKGLYLQSYDLGMGFRPSILREIGIVLDS